MTPSPQSAHLRPLLLAWLALVGLTLLGNQLGTLLHGAAWLQIAVAGIVWLKGYLVADRFIEMREAHPFIRNVLRGFIAAHCPFPLLTQDGPMLDIATAFSIRAMRTLAQLSPAQAQEVLLASCYLSTFGVCLVSPEQAPGPSGPVH